MITVHWHGRLGNQLFEYALGRILSEMLEYTLQSGPLEGFAATRDEIIGKTIESQVSLTGQHVDLNFILQNRDKLGFILNGWFQRYEYYQPHKAKIRSWFNRDRKPGSIIPTARDMVIHIRRTQEGLADTKVDYIFDDGWFNIEGDRVGYKPAGFLTSGSIFKANQDLLPFEFYSEILDAKSFDRLILVTDCPQDPFLDYFHHYNPIIVSGNILDDFNIVRSAKQMIMSMSTFSWWAAFLSDASDIYMPVPNYAAWGPKSPVDLRVTDEDRYHLIPVIRNRTTLF